MASRKRAASFKAKDQSPGANLMTRGKEMTAPMAGGMSLMTPDHILTTVEITPTTGGGKRRTSDILAITDKISRALTDFGNMYDENGKDVLLMDVTDQVNSMEGGQLKYQLKTFINNYKDMSSHISEIHTDRDEILENLSDWFTNVHLDVSMVNYDDETPDSEGLRDSLLDTKMGFDKLKMINAEIHEKGQMGRQIEHLEAEKQNLQVVVMQQFKDYKEKAKEENPMQKADDSQQKAWKYAAKEICDLLHKVRDDGADYITELEKKMKQLLRDLDDQTFVIKRLQSAVKEHKAMEKKWQDDNMELMEEKAQQARKITRLKEDVKKYKKAVQAKAANKKADGTVAEEDDEDDGQGQGLRGGVPGMRGGALDDPAIQRAQLRDVRNQLEAMTQDNERYKERIRLLENELEEKDDDLMKLEHDNKELLHQMKQASVRPDVRQLSQIKAVINTASNHSMVGSVTGIAMKAAETTVSTTGPHKCPHCGCHETATKKSSSVTVTKTSAKPSLEKTIVQTVKTSSMTVAVKVNCESADQGYLADDLEESQIRVKELELDLAKANQEITRLKNGKAVPTRAGAFGNQVDANKGRLKAQTSQPGSQRRASQVVRPPAKMLAGGKPGAKPSKVQAAAATDEKAKDDDSAPGSVDTADVTIVASTDVDTILVPPGSQHMSYEHNTSSKETVYVHVKESMDPATGRPREVLMENKAVQTTAMTKNLNNGNAWSKAREKTIFKRPPIPPTMWLSYDPDAVSGTPASVEDNQLLSEATPAEVHLDTSSQWQGTPAIMEDTGEPQQYVQRGQDVNEEDTFGYETPMQRQMRKEAANNHYNNFMERELEHMRYAIIGYVDYINQLIDREAKLVADANPTVRARMSQTDLHHLEKELTSPYLRKTFSDIDMYDAMEEKTYGANGYGSRGVVSYDLPGRRLSVNPRNSRVLGIPDIVSLASRLDKVDKMDKGILEHREQTIEDRIKRHLTDIGREAVASLKKAYDMVYATLQDQHRQYQYTVNQMRDGHPEGSRLSPKRSHSHGMLNASNELTVVGSRTTDMQMTRSSKSLSSVDDSLSSPDVNFLENLFEIDKTPQLDKSAPTNKEKMAVAMATIPKQGLIRLITPTSEQLSWDFSDLEKVHRKTRPTPQNHKKLSLKQKELTNRNPGGKGRRQGAYKHQVALTQHKTENVLPEDFFKGYTVADLEKRAVQFAEKTSYRNRHQAVEDHVVLPKLNDPKALDASATDKQLSSYINQISQMHAGTSLPPL